MPTSSPVAAWVALAVFAQPHGVSGRIKVKSFTEPADDFINHPTLTDELGKAYKLQITGHAQGLAIVTIEGVTDRNQADLLRGKKLGVVRSAMPELKEPNRFYTDDLIGMAVVEANGVSFGTVTAVANYGAGDILDILRPDGKNEMFAFNDATFPTIDQAARRITINPPELLK